MSGLERDAIRSLTSLDARYLQISNNLSDLNSASTARTNLGISATNTPITDTGGYYTGTDVETALQEIGAGTTLDARYLQIANDLSDLNSATTALTNLGFTASITELNYTSGVTSAIQTQLDAKLAKAGGTMTGAITLSDQTDAIKTGDYTGYFEAGVTGVGTIPSTGDANIVSYWKLDDNKVAPTTSDAGASYSSFWGFTDGSGSTLTDDVGSYNGTIGAGCTWNGSSIFTTGDSLNFPGVAGQTVNVGRAADGKRGFEIWCKLNSTPSALKGLLMRWDVLNDHRVGLYITSSNEIAFVRDIGGTTGYGVTSDGTYSSGDIVHVVGQIDPTNGMELYINGVKQAATDASTAAADTDSSEMFIGDWGDEGGKNRQMPMDCYFAAVHSSVMTEATIKRRYATGLSTLVADSVGTNTGTITNATFTGSGAFGYTGDNSLSFDGTGDYVNAGTASDITTLTQGTVYAWVKGNSGNTGQAFSVGDASVTNTYYVLGNVTIGGQQYFGVRYQKATVDQLYGYANASSARTDDGEWHMIAFTVDGSGNKFYIDGVEQTLAYTVGNSATTKFFSDAPLFDTVGIGYRSSGTIGGYWNGVVDNVVVFNDVRTAQEILADYNNGLASGDAYIINTSNTLGPTGNLLKLQNNGSDIFTFGVDGEFVATDLTIGTDLIITDSTLNTIDLKGVNTWQNTAGTDIFFIDPDQLGGWLKWSPTNVSLYSNVGGVLTCTAATADFQYQVHAGSGIKANKNASVASSAFSSMFGASAQIDNRQVTIVGWNEANGVGLVLKKGASQTGNALEVHDASNNRLAGWDNDGKIDVTGFAGTYVAKTGTYTLTATDYTVDCTANSFTVTLPTASGITGRIYNIKNSGNGTITIDGNGSETIDGQTTQQITEQYVSVTVQSNGTNWIII